MVLPLRGVHSSGFRLVLLDIGRNDWWKFGRSLATWRNLKRLRETIQAARMVETGLRGYALRSMFYSKTGGWSL